MSSFSVQDFFDLSDDVLEDLLELRKKYALFMNEFYRRLPEEEDVIFEAYEKAFQEGETLSNEPTQMPRLKLEMEMEEIQCKAEELIKKS